MQLRDARIIAVDPGAMTGIAVWHPNESLPSAAELDIPGVYEFVEHEVLNVKVPTHIVCEAYLITQATIRNTRQYWSLELIGLFRWAAWRSGATFGKLQTAATAKSFATDDRLKALGWWRPGKGHANDALRHLLTYTVMNRMHTL